MNQAVKVLLDLLVIFLFVLGIAKGAKKGFVQTLYQAIRWIVCIILAQILYPYVAEFLQKIGLTGMLQKSLERMIGSAMQGSGNTSMIQSLPLPDLRISCPSGVRITQPKAYLPMLFSKLPST